MAINIEDPAAEQAVALTENHARAGCAGCPRRELKRFDRFSVVWRTGVLSFVRSCQRQSLCFIVILLHVGRVSTLIGSHIRGFS